MSNVELFNNSNEKYLLEFLQPPLRDILKKLKKIKEEYTHVDFIQFFAKLDENEKHYVSKLLLKYEEDAKQQSFEQLLIQLHKKNWKVIVNDIKDKIARAKNEGDTTMVAKILQDFLELKQTMLKKEMI